MSGNGNSKVGFTLDGTPVTAEVEARELLTDVLRHKMGSKSVHVGCEQGVCGACTVIINGQLARSCLVLAVQVHGQDVTTLRGITESEQFRAISTAFSEFSAIQCGFCTPGFVVALYAALVNDAMPTSETKMREYLSGNLCRCTGYQGLVRAALSLRDSDDCLD